MHKTCDILQMRDGAHCAIAPIENCTAAYPNEVNKNVLLWIDRIIMIQVPNNLCCYNYK